jgi:hypothetical protein
VFDAVRERTRKGGKGMILDLPLFTGGFFAGLGSAGGIFWTVISYVVVFIIGVFIGDFLEGRKKK